MSPFELMSNRAVSASRYNLLVLLNMQSDVSLYHQQTLHVSVALGTMMHAGVSLGEKTQYTDSIRTILT